MSRLIAIGDVHGCDFALETLLNEIQPTTRDTLVFLGDYVDRGPNSNRVLDILVDLITHCRVIPLIGNHEIMVFKGWRGVTTFDFWMMHGGRETLASYGGDPRNVPQDHMTFLSHCLRHHETERHIFLHACYDPFVSLDEQPDQILFWRHIFDDVPPPFENGKTVVVGHTPQQDGTIRNLGHILMIDTNCYGNGWLTAVDVNSDFVWQANNLGKTQTSYIPAIGV
ncbi:MAG: metallophosphoesterase family protein [Pirellulaceae bacterium]